MKKYRNLATIRRSAVLLSGIVSTSAAVAAEKGHTWNAFQADFNALGGACISPTSDDYKAPAEGAIDRTASYQVTFSKAGSYDLYVRWIPGTFYFSRSFGDTPEWQEVKNVKGAEGQYVWLNLSESLSHKKTGDVTFDVGEAGNATFKIAARTRATRIDAFAFGKAGGTFTDAQLDAAVLKHPAAEAAGLVGFQAEAAAAYGKDTLSAVAQKLQDEYASRLSELTREIQAALPSVPDSGKAELIDSLKNELAPEKSLTGLEKTLRQFRSAEDGLLAAQEKLRVAPTELLVAERSLEAALALPDSQDDKAAAVEQARKSVEGWKRNLEKLPGDVKKRQAFFDKASSEMAALLKQVEAAKEAGEAARSETRKVLESLNLDSLLSSNSLDSRLAQYTIIAQATPRALARFAAESAENKANLNQLFTDTPLMLEMLVADGASGGNYGAAIGIFKAIQSADPKAKEGLLRRLALAVALAHASPIGAEPFGKEQELVDKVDPVKRYLSYAKAYENGELDPAFKDLNVWELTMVVDSKQADEALAWGREMMRSYRPDLIERDYADQRYAHIVDQEIQYTSQFVKEDKPELRFMQNILANGGICGRRAFFGRFVLKAFGIPTVARPEPGHATLAHYTPDDGWKAYLGGDWGNRARIAPYGRDMHFLLNTLAREDEGNFMKVKRAQWIGDALGEPAVYGLHGGEEPRFWHAVAIAEQNRIADQVKVDTVSQPSGINEPEKQKPVVTAADRQVTVDSAGVITIPAVATKVPEVNTAVPGWGPMEIVTFMESSLGGKQLHYSRYGGPQLLEYTFDAPKAGKYKLTSEVVTTYWDMGLVVSANGSGQVEMPLPFTNGLWETTEPAVVDLKAGTNTLAFARALDMRKGISIHHFTLSPIE